MNLPVHQVHKGQPRPAELLIQPNAEVMQGDLRGQARLKPAEIMGPFTIQAEGMMELLVHRLHHLAYPRQPATEPLGPRRLAMALGRPDDLSALDAPPRSLIGLALEALVNNRGTQRGRSDPDQTRLGLAARSKKLPASG